MKPTDRQPDSNQQWLTDIALRAKLLQCVTDEQPDVVKPGPVQLGEPTRPVKVVGCIPQADLLAWCKAIDDTANQIAEIHVYPDHFELHLVIN